MKNFVFGLFLILLFCTVLSCGSTPESKFGPPTSANPYRPLSEISNASNANVLGIVHISNYNTGVGRDKTYSEFNITKNNDLIYLELLRVAKEKYGDGNIDVVDITWSSGSRDYSFNGTGKVIAIGNVRRLNNADGIEGAIERAAEELAENFTARSRLAIVYITAQDRSTTEFISGELEHLLRRQGHVIIDRSELDRIRREHNFQMSGEVDDSTAVSIGKFAGANIIVTGRVDGEGNLRRLRLRALDTTSAQVVGTASERL